MGKKKKKAATLLSLWMMQIVHPKHSYNYSIIKTDAKTDNLIAISFFLLLLSYLPLARECGEHTGTGVFWIPGMTAALSFSICSLGYVILRVWCLLLGWGFTCGAAFWVRLHGLAVGRLWNRNGLSKWTRLSTHLVFQGHAVASAGPTPSLLTKTEKYHPNCPPMLHQRKESNSLFFSHWCSIFCTYVFIYGNGIGLSSSFT